MQSMLLPYRKLYRLIEGRSQRKEFWMFFLLNVLIFIAVILVFGSLAGSLAAFGQSAAGAQVNPAMGPGALAPLLASLGVGAIGFFLVLYVWMLATMVAALAVSIRRLHDLGFTGWAMVGYYILLPISLAVSPWLYFALLVGFLVVMALPGSRGANKYGPDPLEGDAAGPDVFA